MAGLSEVLVVHCVDTEGPIGGDVRRRSDGRKEFMGSWAEISDSLKKLTNKRFREDHADSFGNPYMFNWFIMDFIGFTTNPKRRIAKYHDTYDHIKKLQTKLDSFHWHYHQPPKDGVGDKWSDAWDSSDAHWDILLHRLVEREDWPAAYRAGGTIEDEKASQWLEKYFLIDYSNRVSDRSFETDDIFDFNWYGAPDHWGVYHPKKGSLVSRGRMKRYIAKSVDLWSRLHTLNERDVRSAFAQAQKDGVALLSYFSHDHRDMNDETRYAINLIRLVAEETGVKWRVCDAVEAVQRLEKIKPKAVSVSTDVLDGRLQVKVKGNLYQRKPLVGMELVNGELEWVRVVQKSKRLFVADVPEKVKKIVIGGTSTTGDSFVHVV